MESLISIPTATLSLTPSPLLRTKPPSSSSLSSTSSSLFNSSSSLRYGYVGMVSVPNRTSKRKSMRCTCLFGLGVPELVVIAGVAALVFGPKKLPEIGRSLGKTVNSFQQAAKEFETEIKKDPDSASDSLVEKPTPAADERKEETKASNTKESL